MEASKLYLYCTSISSVLLQEISVVTVKIIINFFIAFKVLCYKSSYPKISCLIFSCLGFKLLNLVLNINGGTLITFFDLLKDAKNSPIFLDVVFFVFWTSRGAYSLISLSMVNLIYI